MQLSVSCTTRAPRETESNGKWYNFISEPEFEQMVARGEFSRIRPGIRQELVWHAETMARRRQSRKVDLVLEIDVQGALQVQRKLPESMAIFVLPPSRQDLEKRIRARGQDSEDEIRRRLDRAREEMLSYSSYDFAVINDDLERAGQQIQAVALGSRCRIARNEERIREILKSFGG